MWQNNPQKVFFNTKKKTKKENKNHNSKKKHEINKKRKRVGSIRTPEKRRQLIDTVKSKERNSGKLGLTMLSKKTSLFVHTYEPICFTNVSQKE